MLVQAPPRSVSANSVDGLHRVDSREWDALVGSRQGVLRHGYLRAWEQVELAGLRSRPLVARHPDGAIAAAAPGYVYDFDPTRLTRARPPAAVRWLRRLHGRLLTLRIYELGAAAALAPPLLHDTRMSLGDAASLIFPAAVEEASAAEAQVAVVQDFPRIDETCAPVLRRLGFAPVMIPPTVVLELGFATFEQYLSSMRAHYRRRARRVFAQSAHLQVERRDRFADLAAELTRLGRKVFERADETRREAVTEGYFRAASEHPDASVLLLRRPDDSIASFALLLAEPPWLDFLVCGFEAEAGREEAAYFRLLYEIARVAIDGGFERLELGTTTLAPKLDLGGIAVPMVAWMRYHRPAVQRLCTALSRRLVKVSAPPPRHVFKDAPAAARLPR
jgi:hypothetical protein